MMLWNVLTPLLTSDGWGHSVSHKTSHWLTLTHRSDYARIQIPIKAFVEAWWITSDALSISDMATTVNREMTCFKHIPFSDWNFTRSESSIWLLTSIWNLKMFGQDSSELFGVTEWPHLSDVRDRRRHVIYNSRSCDKGESKVIHHFVYTSHGSQTRPVPTITTSLSGPEKTALQDRARLLWLFWRACNAGYIPRAILSIPIVQWPFTYKNHSAPPTSPDVRTICVSRSISVYHLSISTSKLSG